MRRPTLLLLAVLAAPRPAHGQLPPPRPDPFAVSIGVSAVLPSGALAAQDPSADTWYATSGSAIVERIAWAPVPAFAIYLEATFPRFGMDTDALQADFGSDPPIVEGRTDVTSWSIGARWRARGGWLSGPFLEAAAGRYRQRTETTQEGQEPASLVFEWEYGFSAAVGWALPVGPAFALEGAVSLHRFREENRGVTVGTGEPFVNRWIDQWLGIRVLAVMTFGGEG